MYVAEKTDYTAALPVLRATQKLLASSASCTIRSLSSPSGGGDSGFAKLHPFLVGAVLELVVAAGIVHEDPAHGFGGGGKRNAPGSQT